MTKKRIGELLIENGLISLPQLDKALEIQKSKGGFLGKILVDLGFVTEEQVADYLMEQGGHAYLPLGNYEVDMDVLELFTEETCRTLGFLPVDKIGNVITVAVADEIADEIMSKIKAVAHSHDVKFFITTMTELETSFGKYFKSGKTG